MFSRYVRSYYSELTLLSAYTAFDCLIFPDLQVVFLGSSLTTVTTNNPALISVYSVYLVRVILAVYVRRLIHSLPISV